jgi:hypothetical protein
VSTWAEAGFSLDSSAERRPLTALARFLRALPFIEDRRFSRVRAGPGGDLEPVRPQPSPMTAEALLDLLQPWDTPDHSVSAWTKLTGYGLDPDTGELAESLVPLRIGSVGGRCLRRAPERPIDADVSLLVPATPYTHPVSSKGRMTKCLDKQRNLDTLTALLHAAVDSLKPITCKVYTDAGEYLPFNAHLAYYARTDEVRRDTALIRDLFTAGRPGAGLPPLGDLDTTHTEIIFHPWRHSDERLRVQHALATAARRGREPNQADVLDVLTSNTLHIDFSGPGFMVSSGPAPMNAFLDGFYLELLDTQ